MADPVFYDGQPGPEIRRSLNEMAALWQQALEEAVGPQGWSPAFGVVADGDRRVLQIVDWVGGAGEKPSITGYIGASGIVPTIGGAIDVRGGQGIQGNQGNRGWSPEISGENHGDRRVLRVDDWVGGEGAKPGTGYIGVSGLVPDISDALDVRGGQGIKGDTGPANVLQIGTVESGETADATITGTTPAQTLNLVLPKGDDAWNPVMATVNDGDRRVIQITDWVDGAGTKPATGYLGPSGVVSTIGAATDIRGTQGIKGNTGDKAWNPVMATVADGDRRVIQITDWTGGEGTKPTAGYLGPSGIVPTIGAATDVRGAQGFKGDTGDSAWTPVYTAVADGERRVLRIDDWVGGQGTKPATGYLGVSGVVANIGDALDIRGAPGSGTVSSVNNVDPDGSGNVTLTKADIGLNNVDNTADADKPLSTAATNALSGKVDNTDPRLTNAREWTASIVSQSEAEAGTATTARKWTAQRVAQAIAALGLKIGTTGTTAAAGNDSRLSDAREWTASVVSQAEAETGTATTARKWTAQRVRQAIVAWWSSVENSKQDTLVSGTNIKTVGGESLLGSGNVAVGDVTLTGTQTLTNKTLGAGTKESFSTASTISITDSSDPFQQITLSANVTASINLSVGASRSIWLNPGTFTVTWPVGTQWKDGDAPELPASKWTLITFTGTPINTSGFGALIWSEE